MKEKIVSKNKRNFLKLFSLLSLKLYFFGARNIKYIKNKTILIVKKKDRNKRLWILKDID